MLLFQNSHSVLHLRNQLFFSGKNRKSKVLKGWVCKVTFNPNIQFMCVKSSGST